MLPMVLPPGASISEWKGPDMVDVDGQLHDDGVVGQGGVFANCAKRWVVGGAGSLSSRQTTQLIPIVGTAGAHKSQITQRAFLS